MKLDHHQKFQFSKVEIEGMYTFSSFQVFLPLPGESVAPLQFSAQVTASIGE